MDSRFVRGAPAAIVWVVAYLVFYILAALLLEPLLGRTLEPGPLATVAAFLLACGLAAGAAGLVSYPLTRRAGPPREAPSGTASAVPGARPAGWRRAPLQLVLMAGLVLLLLVLSLVSLLTPREEGLGLGPRAPATRLPAARPKAPGAVTEPAATAVAEAPPIAAAAPSETLAPATPSEPPAVVAPPPASPTVAPSASPPPSPSPAAAPAPPACEFGASFADLAKVLGSDLVGSCLEDERVDPNVGLIEQRTNHGVLSRRGPDGVATFTDGPNIWYACATGLARRRSGEPFRCPRGVLLADNFDDPAGGHLPMSSLDPAHSELGYADGEYVVKKIDPRWRSAAAAMLPGSYADAVIAVDAHLLEPVERRFVVIGCRSSDDFGSQYRLAVSPTAGTFSLSRWDRGRPVQLTGWQESSAIHPGSEVNHLELTCVGNTIGASINRVEVAAVQDGTYAEGGEFLMVSPPAEANGLAAASFDNLVVLQP